MKKIFPYEAGKTLNSHKEFLRKLIKKGAKVVDSPEKSDVTIVFCPIVSRYMTDIESALSSVPGKQPETKLILVTMHHTFDKDYILPKTEQNRFDVKLHVDCLFHEQKGLFTCPRNKDAIKKVREQLHLERIVNLMAVLGGGKRRAGPKRSDN